LPCRSAENPPIGAGGAGETFTDPSPDRVFGKFPETRPESDSSSGLKCEVDIFTFGVDVDTATTIRTRSVWLVR
jgi:hypothetical protein